jgi:hypothetical protein
MFSRKFCGIDWLRASCSPFTGTPSASTAASSAAARTA